MSIHCIIFLFYRR